MICRKAPLLTAPLFGQFVSFHIQITFKVLETVISFSSSFVRVENFLLSSNTLKNITFLKVRVMFNSCCVNRRSHAISVDKLRLPGRVLAVNLCVCGAHLKILILFQNKIYNFPCPISNQTLKSISYFKPCKSSKTSCSTTTNIYKKINCSIDRDDKPKHASKSCVGLPTPIDP